MALAGELAKYIGNELVNTGSKAFAKAGATSTLSSLVPKVATDVATKTALGGILPSAAKSASDSMMHFLPKKNIPVETPQLPFVDMPKDMMANSMLQGEFHENPEIQQMRSLDELLGYDDFPKDRQELRTAVIDALANRDTDDLTAKEILSQTPLLTRIFSNEQQLADQIGSGRLSSVSLASPSMLRYKNLVDFYGGDKPIITVLDVPEATRNGIYLGEGDLNTPTDFDKRRSVDEHNKLMEQYLDDYGIKKYDFGGFNDESWKDADWYMRTQNGRTSSGYAEGVADLGKNSIALRTNSIKRDDDMLNDLMDMIIEKARDENGREWLERIIPGSTEVPGEVEMAIKNSGVGPDAVKRAEGYLGGTMLDKSGKPITFYHSTPNEFSKFDDARLGENTGYDNTALGHFVTTDKDFSKRFIDIDNTGKTGRTMELRAKIQKPITHPYMAGQKYDKKELDKIVEDYLIATNNQDGLESLRELAEEDGTSLYDEYMDMTLGADSPFEYAADDRKALLDNGYDAVEIVEGPKSGLVEGSNDDSIVSSYAVLNGDNLVPVRHIPVQQDNYVPLYHQTSANSLADFSPDKRSAGASDATMPEGIFLKETNADIGLPGKNQLQLDAKLNNPLRVINRDDLKAKLIAMNPKVAKYLRAENDIDNLYEKLSDEAQTAVDKAYEKMYYDKSDANKKAFAEATEKMKGIIPEWREKIKENAATSQKEIKKLLKENGYDGMIMDEDRGSFGRKVKSYLVLDKEQLRDNSVPVKFAKKSSGKPDMQLAKIEEPDAKYAKLVNKAKGYKSLDRFEKMNNPIKGSVIWGEKPTSAFQRDSRAVRINMFPNEAVKGTGITKQYLLNLFKDAYDQGITDIVPSYGSYTKEGASFMDHLAEQGWIKDTSKNGWKSYEISPKIAEWEKTSPLADIYNNVHNIPVNKSVMDKVAKYLKSPTDASGNPMMTKVMPEYTTIYHNTPLDNVDSIVKNGIKADAGARKYADKSEVGVWGSSVKGDGYGGSTIAFRMPADEAKKYMVNDTEYLIPRDIAPEDIVDVDRMLMSSGGATLRQSQIPEKIAKYGEDKVVEVMKRFGADDNTIKAMLGKNNKVSKYLEAPTDANADGVINWNDVKSVYAQAEKQQKVLDKMARSISEKEGYPEYKDFSPKSIASMENKVARKGGDYSLASMKDHTRNKIMMNSWNDVEKTINDIAEVFGGTPTVEYVVNDWGYKGLHITGRFDNGLGWEIQLTTPEDWPRKLRSDAIYDKWRNVKLDTASPKEVMGYLNAMRESNTMWAESKIPDLSMFDNTRG